MARSFSRPGWWVFLHIKLPAAASAIFDGLEIGIVLALIGAVVGEFVAAERGIGYLIGSATVNMNTAVMFAGVLILALFGVVSSLAVRCSPDRIRTGATALRGRRPRPLDDGARTFLVVHVPAEQATAPAPGRRCWGTRTRT